MSDKLDFEVMKQVLLQLVDKQDFLPNVKSYFGSGAYSVL